jgi:predicted enzyme related to lactoylglutathione lyase
MKLISPHSIVSILVTDQDEALCFYTQKLGLERRKDINFGPGLRLVTVAPAGQPRPEIVLAKPEIAWHGEERVKEVMGQIGKRHASLFATENCRKDYEQLLARGVHFAGAPTRQLYGLEAVFTDPYGNTFVLLEAAPEALLLFESRGSGSAA